MGWSEKKVVYLAWWHKPIIPANLDAEARGLQVQGFIGLRSEFKASVSNGENLSQNEKVKKRAGRIGQW